MEIVYKYVRDVIVPGAKAAYEAFHKFKGADLIVTGIDEAGLIGYVESEVSVLFNADDVALFLLDGLADQFDEFLSLSGALQAHDNFDHASHAPLIRVQRLLFWCIYSLSFFGEECNM